MIKNYGVEISSDNFPFYSYEFAPSTNKDAMHWHSYYQIGLCINGKGKYLFGDKTYEISKGDIFIVNNHEHHIAVSDSVFPANFLFVFFKPGLIAKSGSGTFDNEYLLPFQYKPESFCNKIDGRSEIAEDISKAMFQAYTYWESKPFGYKLHIAADVRMILALLVEHYGKIVSNLEARYLPDINRIQPALDYIKDNFQTNLSLEEVSEVLHMSVSRFRHLFKDIMNINFKEYIFYLRVTEAQKRLAETDMSISEIIYDLGFSNINQFYTLFYKYTLTTPSKYRCYVKAIMSEK